MDEELERFKRLKLREYAAVTSPALHHGFGDFVRCLLGEPHDIAMSKDGLPARDLGR
jgi:hypothetical protein